MSVEERRRHLASLPESMRRMSLDNSALDTTTFRSRIPVWDRSGHEGHEGADDAEVGAVPVATIMEEPSADGAWGLQCVVVVCQRWHPLVAVGLVQSMPGCNA